MNNFNKDELKRRSASTGRKHRNMVTTKSGKDIKIHRNLSERFAATRDAKARRKAIRMSGLPKSRFKRLIFLMHPKRVYKYWFSRDGGIMALKITGVGIIAAFILLAGIFAYFRKDLPNLRDISGNSLGGSISYYDKTGQTLLFEDFDGVKRVPVKGTEISQFVKDATVAVEDRDFFKHGGFDTRGIARAAVNDVAGSGARQGGSTITQQLVKLNNDWTNDRTVTRKIKELILAVELERSYSKQDILTGYLNAAPYGNVQYGVEVAARDYFQKSAKDLTLDESAFLAGIPKSPSYLSPYGAYYKEDPKNSAEETKGRQGFILDQMLQQGMITAKQHTEAKAIDTIAKVKEPKLKFDGIQAPYFVLTAKQQLEAKFGDKTLQRGGWKVITTLDLGLQKIAEDQVQKGLRQIQRQGGDTAAFAAEDVKTGQVVALVGGVDFNNQVYGQNNYAHDYQLPPGSTFKPYDYAALIEHTDNFGAGSVLFDSKGPLEGYPCTKPPARKDGNCAIDYDLRYPGPVTLRYALGGSRNIPAMKAMLTVGVDKTIGTAKKLMTSPGTPEGEARGNYKCYYDEAFQREAPCSTAAAIGDGAYLRLDENVHGYASISRNGLNIPQTYILKVEDASGKMIDEWKPSKGVQAIREDAAYIVADMMSDPNASYLSKKPHSYKGWKFGFKTGTTNDSKDGWMMGISAQYAVGTWVGYHDRTVEMSGFMENMTQPIISGFMNAAHDNLPPEDRKRPAGIKTAPAYVIRNSIGGAAKIPSPATDIYPSYFKTPTADNNSRTIDKISGKLATDCTPERAKQQISGASASSLSGDRFVPGGGANLTQKDDVHQCSDAKPQVTSVVASGSTVTISVAQGTHPLVGKGDKGGGRLILKVDDQIVQSIDMDGATQYTVNTPAVSGQETLVVEVIDSVLYDGSASTQITGAVATSGMTLTAKKTDKRVEFTWTGGTGPYNVAVALAGGATNKIVCSNRRENTCTVEAIDAPNGSKATVTDSTGQRASTDI